MLKKIKKSLFVISILTSGSIFAQSNAAVEVDTEQDQILGHAGKVKIKAESCAKNRYTCDYVLYDAKGKRQVLLEQWSKTAHVYQFNPYLMGFLMGLQGVTIISWW